MTAIRSALWLPLFDALADARTVADLAAEAEDAGWDGVFVWDHVRWYPPIEAVADPWITLAAIATATESVRFGPMVSPLPRRRPAKLARETATLDRLGGGRLILGAGIGADRYGGEFSAFGEVTDDRARGAMLDESLAVLTAAWSGEPVRHRGEHYTVDDVRFLPTPVRGHVPVWIAGYPGKVKPLRRAERHDGYFPVNLETAQQFSDAIGPLTSRPGFDIAVGLPADADIGSFAAAGATWWLAEFDQYEVSVADVRAVIRNGPAGR